MKATLLELAKACSDAAFADRVVDARIACVLDNREVFSVEDGVVLGRNKNAPHDICVVNWAPHYTASLDAAVSLVPDGFDWILERTNDGLTIGARVGHNDPDRHSWGNNPVLALAAGALQARAELLP